jgi:hypothetical protein
MMAHRMAAVDGAPLIRRDEQHEEIVDAEIAVDRCRSDDLAAGSDLRLHDGLDALGADVGLERKASLADSEERVRLDPSRRVGDRRRRDG